MFYGQYSVNIDSKGRISLPKPIKESLVTSDVLVNQGFDGALFVFDRTRWEETAGQYLEKPLHNEDARAIRRQTFAYTFVVKVDDQGRILIPQRLFLQSTKTPVFKPGIQKESSKKTETADFSPRRKSLHIIKLTKGSNQLIVIGAGDHFEIWIQTAWEAYIERIS